MNKKEIAEEFRTIVKNLEELYRRINIADNPYKHICGAWFADQAYELVETEEFKSRLNPSLISKISIMANRIKMMPEIKEKDAFKLNNLVKDLENLQADKLGL